MSFENEVKNIVEPIVSGVIKSDQENITPEQLTTIITRSISKVLESDEFESLIDCKLGDNIR